MTFLTVFTAPKPFTNPHVNIIQRNAIGSWKQLEDVEVIVIGDEAGIPETAIELGAKNIPVVARDDKGIPTVKGVMEIAHAHANSPFLCYVNADIMLTTDIVEATRKAAAQAKDFLLVGRRWNLEVEQPFDFSDDWEVRLREEALRRGKLFSPWGIDYFVFPRALYTEVPNFTIGRVAWDNWMIYCARKTFGTAIDATHDVVAVHQNHDYSHIPEKTLYGTEVAKANLAKAGGRKCIYNTLDTNRELVDGRVRRPRLRLVRMLRKMEHLFTNDRGRGWSWEAAIRLQRWQRRLDTGNWR